MNVMWVSFARVVALLMLLACVRLPSAVGQEAAASLAGSSWELVKFQGSDDTTLTPDDKSKYTLAFDAKGNVTVWLDCNRGRGRWKSEGPNQLQFGPLALTRAMCPAGSLYDQMAKNWNYVRGYVLKGGHLYLSLMADGGIYEYEPAGAGATTPEQGSDVPPRSGAPIAPRGPFVFSCAPKLGGAASPLKITYYSTDPGLALIEFRNTTRPTFQALSGSGAKYESKDAMFWEHQGEAMLTWSGVDYSCKRSAGK
jgi:heat shock protein HslJ